MSMPANLYIVRHGESEGNIAIRGSRQGDNRFLKHKGFITQHSSKWRLTELGKQQAKQAGEWLRQEYPDGLDFYYTSEYSRSLETAALLNIAAGEKSWRISPYLRERYWGDFDRMSNEDKEANFETSLMDADATPYYWRPPNGESFVDVSAREKLLLGTLSREFSGDNGILVCHGEVIQAIRIELERLCEHDYLKLQNDSKHRVKNCDIIHYTRYFDKELTPYFNRKRIISDGIPGDFMKIERKQYSDADLLEMADKTPAYFAELIN